MFSFALIPVFSLFFQIRCTYLMSGTSVKPAPPHQPPHPQTQDNKEPQEILRPTKNNNKIVNKDYSFRGGLPDNSITRNSLLIN